MLDHVGAQRDALRPLREGTQQRDRQGPHAPEEGGHLPRPRPGPQLPTAAQRADTGHVEGREAREADDDARVPVPGVHPPPAGIPTIPVVPNLWKSQRSETASPVAMMSGPMKRYENHAWSKRRCM